MGVGNGSRIALSPYLYMGRPALQFYGALPYLYTGMGAPYLYTGCPDFRAYRFHSTNSSCLDSCLENGRGI